MPGGRLRALDNAPDTRVENTCYTVSMNEWTSFIGLAALIIGLFAWQRQDMKTLGNQLRQAIRDQNERIDKLYERLGQVEQGMASLKATVETFFRLRVDPPDPDRRRTGTDG